MSTSTKRSSAMQSTKHKKAYGVSDFLAQQDVDIFQSRRPVVDLNKPLPKLPHENMPARKLVVGQDSYLPKLTVPSSSRDNTNRTGSPSTQKPPLRPSRANGLVCTANFTPRRRGLTTQGGQINTPPKNPFSTPSKKAGANSKQHERINTTAVNTDVKPLGTPKTPSWYTPKGFRKMFTPSSKSSRQQEPRGSETPSRGPRSGKESARLSDKMRNLSQEVVRGVNIVRLDPNDRETFERRQSSNHSRTTLATSSRHDSHANNEQNALTAGKRDTPTPDAVAGSENPFTKIESYALHIGRAVDPFRRPGTSGSNMSMSFADAALPEAMEVCTHCGQPPKKYIHSGGLCDACHEVRQRTLPTSSKVLKSGKSKFKEMM
ncbi:hypothetical protein K470DRAFT_296452 [Piedraia hortae CBS 480.64]|uniref:Uncharacterized protein n=1 Tax=Piedraia hortae CBS 480.64 TaxID=1314780 RepID=A0A6A7BTV2_9PEZI|nr:hypothetical protein K470DRAFT_296452 [Piedraia hortae CBS 480.64]